MNANLAGLPPQDRRWRFHGAVKGLSRDTVRRLACADPARQCTWLATTADAAAVVAEVTWALDQTGRAAETALVVMPRWRRQGVALHLLQWMARRCRHRGLDTLYGHVMEGNQPMAALLERLGPAVARRHAGAGVLRVEWRVPA
ncbi:MAG: GNAT family N-acetyltransferase [Proteobacteria bacterium]|nr:GNAT family N-acetyltransferase [Pseudomonadota bacterium]